MDDPAKVVSVEADGYIAEVTLCNPKKRNSMGVTFQDDLENAFKEVSAMEEVRVVILKGEGLSFCAGLDLMAMGMVEPALMQVPSPTKNKPGILDVIRRFQQAINSVEKCSKPVIAAIHGHCIGGGLDLAAACDIRLCSKDAIFSLRETRVGLMADLGSLQRLPGIIGEGRTRQLAYTAEDFGAQKAFDYSLVNEVYEDRDELLEAAREMAKAIAANAPLAVQASKDVLNWGRGRPMDETLEYVAVRNLVLLPCEDVIEAVASFAERRAPEFKGK